MLGKLTQTASNRNDCPNSGRVNPFRLTDIVKTGRSKLTDKILARLAEHATGLYRMARIYETLDKGKDPFDFARISLDYLNIDHDVVGGSLDHVPEKGACIVVANHPFGGIEGILAARLIRQRRPDVKIIANGLLKRVPEFSNLFIGVNPYAGEAAARDNSKPMRDAIRWLKAGGLLVVFPAGDVSMLNLRKFRIADGQWDTIVPRLARNCGAPIVSIYFGGRNSWCFHLIGMLHPRLKTALLPRELLNKQNCTLKLWISESIPFHRLRGLGNDTEIAKFLRLFNLMLRDLGNNKKAPDPLSVVAKTASRQQQPIREPVAVERLCREIESLNEERRLASSGDLCVYYAYSYEIPFLLQEIGRLRETMFRAVGEGTGKPMDIDFYDNYYLQLFIWDSKTKNIAGAYRLGLSDEILRKYGKCGFYSHSLFKYRGAFIRTLGPFIEMGRSFVSADYQRSFAPLMLLWKGIGMYIAHNPHYATLIGPVSISNDYNSLSQKLLIDFLKVNNFDAGLGRRVRARRPYSPGKPLKFKLHPVWRKTDLADIQSIQVISELLSLIEGDDKGVPVLIKQYLKMGGRMLGFNVDQQFGDCIDGLMVTDLRCLPPNVLKRYMGTEGAGAFLVWHDSHESDRGSEQKVI
jgi:putative hemolysin